MMLTGNMVSGPVSELVLGLVFACILVEHLLTVGWQYLFVILDFEVEE